jgi:hypothetical protein
MKQIISVELSDEQLRDLISKKVKYIDYRFVVYPDLLITIKRSD